MILPMDVRGYALVVGNNAYVHDKWSRLGTAIHDAIAIADLLRSVGYIVVDGHDLSYGQFQEKLRDFQRILPRTHRPPTILFSYSGHGFWVQGDDYLAPVDAQYERGALPEIEHLKLAVVFEKMKIYSADRQIAFINACRDDRITLEINDLEEDARTRGDHEAAEREASRIIRYQRGAREAFTLFATSPGHIAYDRLKDTQHSPFGHGLILNLTKPGHSLVQIGSAVRDYVIQVTDGRPRGVQSPTVHLDGPGDYVINPVGIQTELPPPPPEPPPGDDLPPLPPNGNDAPRKRKGRLLWP